MTHLDIIHAWKDEEYRVSLSDAERAQLLEHPAGVIELSGSELASVQGGYGPLGGHLGPYIRNPFFNYPNPSYGGVCGVNMSCLKEDTGGGVCGVNMSCG